VRYLRNLMGQKVFNNPKDHEVLARLIRYCTSATEHDIVLDSFAGSGTTGHAVLLANSEDGGNRQFILIEMEDYADTLTSERVRRVINGVEKSGTHLSGTGLGSTFSFFRLGETIDIEAVLSGDPKQMPSYQELARYLFYTSTGEEFVPQNLDEARNYIGASQRYDVYLFYKPDVEYLQNTALTLEMVIALPKPSDKELLVFAPTHFVDSEYLEQYKVKFVRLPFEIYRFPSS
jgi:adenine-specific DNA-methyltransferase